MSPTLVAVLLGPGTSPEEGELPLSLNRVALIVFVLSGTVAFIALFSLPMLLDAGLSFVQAFALICAVEFMAALTSGYAGYTLYTRREEE